MREDLSVFRDLENPNRWQGPFRGSPTRWKAADGEAIVRALQDAKANPIDRPLGRLGRTIAKAAAQHDAANDTAVVPEAARRQCLGTRWRWPRSTSARASATRGLSTAEKYRNTGRKPVDTDGLRRTHG